jgi:hypothetical protein
MARSSARNSVAVSGPQPSLPLRPSVEEHLDVPMLEQSLWDAACEIRGATDAPKFKDFILPLVFFKRLSDVFDERSAVQNPMLKYAADIGWERISAAEALQWRGGERKGGS